MSRFSKKIRYLNCNFEHNFRRKHAKTLVVLFGFISNDWVNVTSFIFTLWTINNKKINGFFSIFHFAHLCKQVYHDDLVVIHSNFIANKKKRKTSNDAYTQNCERVIRIQSFLCFCVEFWFHVLKLTTNITSSNSERIKLNYFPLSFGCFRTRTKSDTEFNGKSVFVQNLWSTKLQYVVFRKRIAHTITKFDFLFSLSMHWNWCFFSNVKWSYSFDIVCVWWFECNFFSLIVSTRVKRNNEIIAVALITLHTVCTAAHKCLFRLRALTMRKQTDTVAIHNIQRTLNSLPNKSSAFVYVVLPLTWITYNNSTILENYALDSA